MQGARNGRVQAAGGRRCSTARNCDQISSMQAKREAHAANRIDQIDVRLALDERRLASEQLSRDDTDTPDVESRSVVPHAEADLGPAVAPRHDRWRHVWCRVAVVTCEAKVTDLDVAKVVVQNVGGLEVAVEDPVVVQVAHALEHLVHNPFHLQAGVLLPQ